MHRSDLIIILALVILNCSSSISFPTYYSSPQNVEDRQHHHGQISQPVRNARVSKNGIETNHLSTCDPAYGCDTPAGGSGENDGTKVAHQARMGAPLKGEVRAQGPGGKKLYARAIEDDFEAKFVLEAQKRVHKQ